MRPSRRHLFAAVLLCCLLMAGAARAATVHEADDSAVIGNIVSLADGKLVVESKSSAKAKPERVTIPMSNIVEVAWREAPPPTPSATPGSDDNAQDSGGGGFWGALFGTHHQSAAVDSSDSPPPPPSPTVTRSPTTRPAGSVHWQFQLTGGDSLHGYIDKWADQKLAIGLDSPAGQSLDLPAEQLAELWAGNDSEQAKARALAVDASASDVVFVRKDSDVVPVKGMVRGIAGDALQFKFGDEDRKIALSRVVGIIMSQAGRKTPPATFRQSVSLHGGDTLIGKWTTLAKGSATLQTNWGQPVQISLAEVDRIDFLDGRVVFLSDLKPAKVEQVPFFGRVIPFRVDCALDGGPIKLSDGMVYGRGIAVHTRCVLEYAIAGKFARFQTKLGFEQPGGQIGRAAIRVLADGKPVYANPDARGTDKPVAVDCDVTGVQTLTLEVDFGKGQDAGGRVIWANARLLRNATAE